MTGSFERLRHLRVDSSSEYTTHVATSAAYAIHVKETKCQVNSRVTDLLLALFMHGCNDSCTCDVRQYYSNMGV